MSALSKFTTNLHAYLSNNDEPANCAAYVAEQLSDLIQSNEWLDQKHRQGCKDEPSANLVHVDPDGLFSVVSFVWQAGQQTCIHDHVCWCVVGVLEGVEEEFSFNLKQGTDRKSWLEPQSAETLKPGHVCQLVPPDADIHQVRNGGTETAISIHVYGTDIGKRGTSINRRFDSLPILEGQSGVPVNWREIDAGVETGIELA